MAIMKVMLKLLVGKCQYLVQLEMASLEDKTQVVNLVNLSVEAFRLWEVKSSNLNYMPKVWVVNTA